MAARASWRLATAGSPAAGDLSAYPGGRALHGAFTFVVARPMVAALSLVAPRPMAARRPRLWRPFSWWQASDLLLLAGSCSSCLAAPETGCRGVCTGGNPWSVSLATTTVMFLGVSFLP